MSEYSFLYSSVRKILVNLTDVTGFEQNQTNSDAFEKAVRQIMNLIELEKEHGD